MATVNIYVGPLVRFHSEKWKPVFIEGKQGEDEQNKHSPFEDKRVSPIELRNYILEWRKEIFHALKRHLNAPLNWSETPETPFVTESFDRRAYDAMRLWAAYALMPEKTKPNELPENIKQDDVFMQVEEMETIDYSQIISDVTMWLPFNLDVVFDAEFLNYDEPITVGSSALLFEQLKKLNSKTWNVPAGVITTWRESKIDENKASFESLSKYGFSVFYNMAQQAVMNKLPMALYH